LFETITLDKFRSKSLIESQLDQAIAVIDVGKTRTKLTLWSESRIVRQADRINASASKDGVAQLDVAGVHDWLVATLADFARAAKIGAVVPVAHGAAAVLTQGDAVVAAFDYEAPPPADIAEDYERERDPFAATLSPRLAGGLNVGAQLYWWERLYPDLWPHGGQALLWPQYWAFVLSGVRASETTSLGCHSDLWRPLEGRFSDLARRRGWAERLGSVRRAGDILGSVRPEIAAATGLPADCAVYCGLHDSNAALYAARGLAELAGAPFSVVSTGTWFVCLNAGGSSDVLYDPAEDMLANVDVDGRPTPTARFMGGRDYEAWMGSAIGATSDPALLAQSGALVDGRTAALALRATWAALQLARRTDRALALINAEGPILVEGRFADDAAFSVALARLRPSQPLYRSTLADGVALGALRLADDAFSPPALQRVSA
jgi:sugar (pentulose or hexulose) kinase